MSVPHLTELIDQLQRALGDPFIVDRELHGGGGSKLSVGDYS